jgi:hypothetical protein
VSAGLAEPRFEAREPLTAARLAAAQRAHRDALRRHRLQAHGPGVVAGLWVVGGGTEEDDETAPLVLCPGYAVDDFGRELMLAEPRGLDGTLDAELSLAPLAEAFVVVLRHRRLVEPERTVDTVTVGLVAPDRLPAVPAKAIDRLGEEPPDSAAPPLAVGTLVKVGEPRRWQFSAAQRRETGAVARAVRRAADDPNPWLEVGDRLRCLLPAPTTGGTEAGPPLEAFTLAADGARLSGRVNFDDAVEIAGDLAFRSPEAEVSDADVAAQARQAARMAPLPETAALGLRRGPGEGTDELRVVLPSAGARFVVAAPAEPGGEPQPLLTVTGDGGVVVHGDLLVEGNLIEQRDVAPRARRRGEAGEDAGEDDSAEQEDDRRAQPEGPMNQILRLLSAIPNNSAPFFMGFLVALGLMVAFPETTSAIARAIAAIRVDEQLAPVE